MRNTTLFVVMLLAATSNAQLFSEGFIDINTLNNWDFVNVSSIPPSGETGWFQGDTGIFSAFEGAENSYLAVDRNSSQCCLISNWAILPAFTLEDGDRLSFYTRTIARSMRPDRLEVRLSVEGIGSALPSTESELGSFQTVLLIINENLDIGGYPEEWEFQNIEISDLGVPTDVRIAFRYYVAAGGVNGINSNYIGIDSVLIEKPLDSNDHDDIDFKYRLANSGELFLESKNIMTKATIFNVIGQELMERKVGRTEIALDISGMPSGVYLMKVEIDGKTGIKRFVKL